MHGQILLPQCPLMVSVYIPAIEKVEFVKGRIKFGKLDAKGKFYLPLNAKGKTQSGTKDSMIVIFDGRKQDWLNKK